jgi:hypothetical protein
MKMDSAASICRRTWFVSKTQLPIRRKIIPLASRNKRVIFALQLGDDMAECNQEKQGMVSAFFMAALFPKNSYHFQFELLLGLL